MTRLFSWLSGIIFALVLMAGVGVYWLSKVDIANAKRDADAAIAKGAALSISANIEQLNKTLDKMAQDPEVVAAMTIGNPAILASVALKLEKYLPGVMKIRLLPPDVSEPDLSGTPKMGFADLDLVHETLEKIQAPGIQGDQADRHLAIARKITQNDQTLGIILASLSYGFINNTLAASASNDIYMELRQAKTVLAAAGNKPSDAAGQDQSQQVDVANTDWTITFQHVGSAAGLNLGIIGCILAPALLGLFVCFRAYLYLSNILSDDLHFLMKAFKDMMTNSLQVGSYPFQLREMGALFSNLMQFKRVLEHDERNYEPVIGDKDELNITVSDDEDFEFDMFFDDQDGLNPR